MTRVIFWDNDGVLADTEGLFFEATRATLAGAGAELTRAHHIRCCLETGRTTFDLLHAKGLDEEQIQALRAERDALYTRLLEAGDCIAPGARELVRRLSARFKMGIVTSSLTEHFRVIHRDSGLLEYFDFVLTREDYELSKPNPEPYLKALARSKAGPEDCVVVEDSARGLAAARAAGIRCIVVPHDFTRGSDFSGAHAVIPSLQQLEATLAELG